MAQLIEASSTDRRMDKAHIKVQMGGAPAAVEAQAQGIVTRLAQAGITEEPDRQIIAIIAYLQRLGRDIQALSAKP